MARSVKEKLCLALDVDHLAEAKNFALTLKDDIGIFKIGSQLFSREGPRAIEIIRATGVKVFLDLKFHDIPNTVANAARAATAMGATIFNVHSLGGSEMMRAAVEASEEEAARQSIPKPIVLAVTLLTSINDLILSRDLRMNYDVQNQVIHLAKLAKSSGVTGVIASPKEITMIRNECGEDFIILTPGIRPTWAADKDDQKRITTPSEAVKLGADYIVVGRPILKAINPIEAAQRILDEMTKSNS